MLRMTNDYKEEKISTPRKLGNLKICQDYCYFKKKLSNYFWHQKYIVESFKVFLNYFQS